jgi:phosphatidylglycerol:prolipoprotein diacylglycerol transferase
MFPIFNLGPLAIQAPGLIILLGIYISFLVVEKQSRFFKINPNDLSNLIFIYLISTIVIGRFAYLFRFPSIIFNDPLSIISINPNLFDFPSGLVLSLLILLIYIQKKKLPLKEVLDSLSLPLITFLFFFFFAQFSSGNLYGKPIDLPWSIFLWGTNRHPLQLYYIVGLLPILLVILRIIKNRQQPGIIFVKTVGLLCGLTIFLDYFNGNPDNVIGNINILQTTAWILLLIIVVLLYKYESNYQRINQFDKTT